MSVKDPSEFAGRADGALFCVYGSGNDLDDGERLVVGRIESDCPYPVRVIDCLIILTGAGIGSGTLKLQAGDGEAEETWIDLTNAMSTDSMVANDIIRPTKMTQANTLVPKGGSLGVLASGNNHDFRIEVIVRREDS